YVGSSIQFRLSAISVTDIPDFLARCAGRGVELKWFGAEKPAAFTSRYDSWRYIPDLPDLPETKAALAKTVDMRIPLTFDVADCQTITQIIAEEMADYRAPAR
ncbi:MAG: aminotransferase, partial [Candidatus Puniceispirillaceae bacterium]